MMIKFSFLGELFLRYDTITHSITHSVIQVVVQSFNSRMTM